MTTEENTSNTAGVKPVGAWAGLCSAELLADVVTDRVFVIDERFKIQCANKDFLSAFGNVPLESVRGHTLGEVLDCRHAVGRGACGCSADCEGCGWFQAVGQSVREGLGEQECRILTRHGDALDFAVRVLPAQAGGGCVCGLKDLFEAKRLRVLERSFFHDVTNLAAGVRGLCELVEDPESGQGEELRPLIHDGVSKLADEIERLRTLRVAENGDLRPWFSAVEPGAVLRAVAARFQEDASARHLEVVVSDVAAPAVFETDRELLTLVFGELARNAIEASTRGERVTLMCMAEGGQIAFSVHNPKVLDARTRAYIFERSFTTKGPGKGVGAYRAKLIAERYLKGTMGFISHVQEGTTFFLKLPLAVVKSST